MGEGVAYSQIYVFRSMQARVIRFRLRGRLVRVAKVSQLGMKEGSPSSFGTCFMLLMNSRVPTVIDSKVKCWLAQMSKTLQVRCSRSSRRN